MATAIARPTTAPTSVLVASAAGGRGLAHEEERRLDALADDRREGEEREAEDPAVHQGAVDAGMQLALDVRRGAAHPEEHPGDDTGGDEHRDALEDLLGRLLQPTDGVEEDEPDDDAQHDRHAGSEPDRPEVALVPGLREVRQDDADDEGRLDALAQAGQQACEEESEVQGELPWCLALRGPGAGCSTGSKASLTPGVRQTESPTARSGFEPAPAQALESASRPPHGVPMIDFSLTDAQREVQRTARAFAEREILPRIRELDETATYDRTLYEKMGSEGLLGLPIPERYGGAGMDYIAFALLCEEMERADTAFRVILSVHTGLNSLTLLQWGSEEQKEKYLVPQARGEKLATFGLTEPGVGSDAANLASTARRDGDRYILNGSKIWISLADTADHVLVFASVDRSKGHRGITAFIVERSFPGFSSESLHGKLGVRAGNTGILTFDDCEVPAANRVGEEGEGFAIAMSALDQGRYTVAAGSVGLARACLDASVRYAHERKTFGSEIGEHQLVKQMLAKMEQGIEAGRLLVWKAGWKKNRGERNTRETSLAKWFTTDHAVQSAMDAIQIHGAYGYSNEYPVERYLRNSKGSVIYEGTSQIHTLMQADYVLGYRKDKPLRMPQPPFEGEM